MQYGTRVNRSPRFGVASDAEFNKIEGKLEVGVVSGLDSFRNWKYTESFSQTAPKWLQKRVPL